QRELPVWRRVNDMLRYTRAFYPNWDAAYAEQLREQFGLDPAARMKDVSRGECAKQTTVDCCLRGQSSDIFCSGWRGLLVSSRRLPRFAREPSSRNRWLCWAPRCSCHWPGLVLRRWAWRGGGIVSTKTRRIPHH